MSEQSQLEQAILTESPQQAENLRQLEMEKIEFEEESHFPHLPAPKYHTNVGTIDEPHYQTKDFVEKHGSLVRRREKRHTGHGGEEERYLPGKKAQQKGLDAKDKLNEFIMQEAWREAGLPENQEYEDGNYNRLFEYFRTNLPGGERSEIQDVEHFQQLPDKLDRLRELTKMNILDASKMALEDCEPRGRRFLEKRLTFYQDLAEGKATKKAQEWDSNKSGYVDRDVPIPKDESTPHTLATGLLRDILYAEMIGTPELAAYKIAMRRYKDSSSSNSSSSTPRYLSTSHIPDLFDYHSGIYYGQEGIGGYGKLRKVYTQAAIKAANFDDIETSPEVIEHAGVMLAAHWYTKSMEYNPSGRGPESPYVADLEESIAWAQLGESVQRQFRGMRQKIMSVDLHNIERFIGKSGDGRYHQELRQLHGEIKYFPYSAEEQHQWMGRINARDLAKVERIHEGKAGVASRKLQRQLESIDSLELPDEEKQLQIQSVTQRYEQEKARLDQLRTDETTRINSRTPDELLEELKERQKAVEQKHQKSKSLAAKAIDLHFRFKGKRDDDRHGSGLDAVDWINDAPLGVINRAHAALQKGVSEETVYAMALSEIVGGDSELNRTDFELVRQLVVDAQQPQENDRYDYYRGRRVNQLLEVSKFLKDRGVNYNLADCVALAKIGGEREIGQALQVFSIDEVKGFALEGIDLQAIAAVKQATENHGHSLDIDGLKKVAKGMDYSSASYLDTVLGHYSLDETQTFIDRGIHLGAVAVTKEATRRNYGNQLPLDEIADIAQHWNSNYDYYFRQVLEKLPLQEAKAVIAKQVEYDRYQKVKDLLAEHGHELSVDRMVDLAATKGEAYDVVQLLPSFSLPEIEMLVEHQIQSYDAIQTKKALSQRKLTSDIDTVIAFAGQSYYLEQALGVFAFEDLRAAVGNGVRLDRIMSTVQKLQQYGASQLTINQVAAVAKEDVNNLRYQLNKQERDVWQTFAAGFTPDEIKLYPFLVSPLVTQMPKVPSS